MRRQDLALYGGRPVRAGPLPVMHPGGSFIGKEELRAVRRVLESKSLYRFYGPDFRNVTGAFESDLKKRFHRKYAVAVTSGTAALHTALVGLGIGRGDEVIIPTYAWVACPDAVVAAGATPVLADVDDSLTLDPRDVRRRLTRRTRAILAVHIRGRPCDMAALQKVAEDSGAALVEDAAQGAGGSYRGRPLGSYGRVGTLSFQLNKMITAGEGGAVVTDDRILYERSLMFHDVGTPFRQFSGKGAGISIKPFPGVNYRMNELSAAVLREQLKKMDSIVRRIKARKKSIKDGIRGVRGIRFARLNDKEGETGISLVFFVKTAARARLFKDALLAENIRTTSGGYPCVTYDPRVNDGHVFVHWGHILPRLDSLTRQHRRSLELLSRAVHLDISPLLTEGDVDDTIEAVRKVAGAVV